MTLPTAEVATLIDLLPEPFPFGDPWNEYVLANQLMRVGRFEDAAHYAAEGYARHPHTLAAATVARALLHWAIRRSRSAGSAPPPTPARRPPAWRRSSTGRPN